NLKVEPLSLEVEPLSLEVAPLSLEVAPLSLEVAPLNLKFGVWNSKQLRNVYDWLRRSSIFDLTIGCQKAIAAKI
ncbi:MAG: hypothetical protein ACYTXY_52545, partial [Nostoc sp.]